MADNSNLDFIKIYKNNVLGTFIFVNGEGKWETLPTSTETLGIKRFKILFTQSGVNAPVMKVLKDSTGATVTASYIGVGDFALTSNIPLFSFSKTFITGGMCSDDYSDIDGITGGSRQSDTIIRFTVRKGTLGTKANDAATDAPLMIEIYP
jgi:hypothetical protein